MKTRTTVTRPRRKAYSYVRFSTPEQAKGDSKRRQTTMAAEYAKLHDLDLDDVLSFQDEGVSSFRGKNAETGKLGDFLEAVRKGIVPQGSVLLVENFDRISRQAARKALRTIEQIVESGVSLVTLADSKEYDEAALDDSMSFMIAMITMMGANGESERKSQRLKKAWEGKKLEAKDKIMTASCPCWLTPNGNKKTRTEWVKDKAKTKVVKRIFAMTVKGHGVNKIGQTLNREGVPPIGRADRWHVSFIQKILQNPAVIGDLHDFKREYDSKARRYVRRPTGKVFEGYYPRIITSATFNKVAAQYANRKQNGAGRSNPRNGIVSNTFAGLARCPKCGGTMTNVNKGGYNKRSLACITAKQGGACDYRSVKLETLELAFVCNAVPALVARVPSGKNEVDKRVNQLRKDTEELEQREELLRELLAEHPSRPLAQEISKTALELEAAEAELRIATGTQRDANHAVMEMRAHDLEVAIGTHSVDIDTGSLTKDYDRAQINACLRRLFDRVVVDYYKQDLVFCWRNGAETRISYKDKPNSITYRPGVLSKKTSAA
jgi:DNA invertase Pin-like site-specific DNA recombinase